jgi:3-hydroxyisobutyrate dehydrogenase-like beta-hydroxyacid dehydrogenase
MTTVAVIGVGAMGSRIAARLLASGQQVMVWNRHRKRLAPLIQLGAVAAATPATATRSAEVVITMLSDASALSSVLRRRDGILAGVDRDVAIWQMSTIGVDATERLAASLPPQAPLLDAPVLGSLAEAEGGRLTILVGGAVELFQRWRPLLAVLGTPLYVGAAGAGSAAKLLANAALLGTLQLFGETLRLADGLGMPREVAYRVLKSTPLAAQVDRRRQCIEALQFPPRFALALAHKDALLIRQAAARRQPAPALWDAVGASLASCVEAGWGDLDYTAMLAGILGLDAGPTNRHAVAGGC